MPATIVVVGSANTDLVVRVPSLPRPGETMLGGTFASVGGGKGANQAVAAARAGGRTRFVAALGDDAFGRQSRTALDAEGIDTSGVRHVADCPSGVALIVVDGRGENLIAVAPGANDRLAPADLDAAILRDADAVLVQLEIPLDTVRHAVRLARAHGRRVILNPAPARDLDADLLHDVDCLTPNETEAEILTGVAVTDAASAEAAARRLLAAGPRAVVVTLGSRGALVATAAACTVVPGHPVTAIDTVAAGDVFNGCLAVALAEGGELVDAVRFANAAAAIAVTRRGARDSAPLRSEIESFLRANPSPAPTSPGPSA